MAWGEVKVNEQRERFIAAYESAEFSLAELCRQYEITRRTGYKWIHRYETFGLEGLKELSRNPTNHPNTTPEPVVQKILQIKSKWPHWGARKILGKLKELHPENQWPSDTTMHNILEREGLVIPRKIRRRVSAQTAPLTECQNCNEVWCVDFKGWFLTGDGNKCEPLTITDNFSRFLLHCADLPRNNTEYVWVHFNRLFREYGLPLFIRSDNGSPFGSTGIGRLCGLAIKLIKCGVIPEWISPGKPQENGRHERMHRTLKHETANPPAETLELQKKRLADFQEYFNYERPHQSIGQKTPGSIYQKSPRSWQGKLSSPEYGKEYAIRKVHPSGQFHWKYGTIYIGKLLQNEPIGLREIDNERHEVRYGPILLGYIDHKNVFSRPRQTSRQRKIEKLS